MLSKDILLHIHKKSQVTRGDISSRFNVGPAAISKELKGMFQNHLITEDGYTESTGGRRSALVKLNPDYTTGLGIEISRQGIRSVRMRFDGSIASEDIHLEDSFAESADVNEGYDRIIGAIRKALGSNGQPAGIGITISGIVDSAQGIACTFPDFPDWKEIPLREKVAEEFGVHVELEALIHASVRGEFFYGIGRKFDDFIYIHVGQGISCGAVFNGRLYNGSGGAGGELGHTVVLPGGPLCYCGKYGCLESVASPLFVEREVREAAAEGVSTSVAGNGSITFAAIMEAAEQGDRLCVNVIEKAGGFLGRAAANLSNVLAPQAVIVGGEFIDEGSIYFNAIINAFRADIMESCNGCMVHPGMLKNKAALIGAGDHSFAHIFR